MNRENVVEEAGVEQSPAALRGSTVHDSEAAQKPRKVVAFKFGGSSLLGAERMLHAAKLVRDARAVSQVSVVVSAMKGVTDRLLSIERALTIGKLAHARREAESILHLHREVLDQLCLDEETSRRVHHELQLLGCDLLHEVKTCCYRDASAELADRLASFGERFSARLFAASLKRRGVASVPIASSDFVLTCDTFRNAHPHLEQTRDYGREILLPLLEEGIVPVVTGFIGATPDGRITTLGRNSSDFSGAIVAYVLDAIELVIWTDVDGIYTTNPQSSVEARLLHELSYEEAHALAASGAKVLHPKVLALAAEREVVVWVRNTFNPEARGTRIGPPSEFSCAFPSGGAA